MRSRTVRPNTFDVIFAGYGDLAFDLVAYGYGAVAVAAQALYLILVQKSAGEFRALETVHLNSYNNLPIMLFCSVAFNEVSNAVYHFNFRNPTFVTLFLCVISIGCALNFLLFLCTTMNSALTTSIVSALKSNLSTVIGMFTFGGISMNVFTLSGIGMSSVGGTWYTYLKHLESVQKSQKVDVPKFAVNGSAHRETDAENNIHTRGNHASV